jgi:4-aminobutyrate aminotransferase
VLGVKQPQESREEGESWIGPAPWIETSIPGPNARLLIERDHSYSSPSNKRCYPLVIKRAVGSVVEDVDGNRFLDFAAGTAVCATGHCHPKVIAAIEEQSRALIHSYGGDFYHPPRVELMERLAAIVPGKEPKRVLLVNSGAEAVEAAMKLSRRHTGRKWIVAFHGAYHGCTMGALSLSCCTAVQHEGFGPLVPMVAHVPYGDVDAIESHLFKHQMAPHEVAAIFVEALQCESGRVTTVPSFLPDLRALCDKHGILLVSDEIQSGTGRTGKWFAFEHFNIIPDIIVMAKGLASGMPLGAVIARADVMDWPADSHRSTFGGNPVCCAAALATLNLVESTYMANAAVAGEQVRTHLGEIAERRKVVTNVRGLGLICALDVVNRKTGRADRKLRTRILDTMFGRGVILLPRGDSGIRFCPPLCINTTQIDVGLRLFDEVLVELA